VSLFYLIVGLLLPAAIHYYVWRRLVRSASWGKRVQLALTIAIAALFLAIPLTTGARMWAPGLARTLGWITMPWLAFVALVALTLLVIDIARPR
jgi:hypothetical protein